MKRSPNPLHDHGEGFYTWHAFDPSCQAELWSTAYIGIKGTILFDPIVWPKSAPAPPSPVLVVKTNLNHDRASASCQTLFEAQFTHQPPNFQSIALAGGGENETAFFHKETATLVIGDALINLPPKPLMPLPTKYCTNASLLGVNLASLLKLPIQRIFFAHGAPILQDGLRQIQKALL